MDIEKKGSWFYYQGEALDSTLKGELLYIGGGSENCQIILLDKYNNRLNIILSMGVNHTNRLLSRLQSLNQLYRREIELYINNRNDIELYIQGDKIKPERDYKEESQKTIKQLNWRLYNQKKRYLEKQNNSKTTDKR